MKVLVVGEFRWEIYEKAFFNAFNDLGFETYKFEWGVFYDSKSSISKLISKVENRFLFGPKINKANDDLLKYCESIKPDLVFIYRGTHIFPDTINKMKKKGAIVFGYNNDDPFSDNVPGYYWRHYLNSIKLYDFVYAYREKNILDYKRIGYDNVEILRSYYINSRNFPISDNESNEYTSDISFIGHFEEDGRDYYIKKLLDNDIKVKVYGDRERWALSPHFEYIEKKCGTIKQVRKDYNLAINSTKIALVFLSKINSDTYTRRCFEIPSAKVFMLCEDTSDMRTMFSSDEEAVYFKGVDDCVEKAIFYLSNSDLRERIAINGYNRLIVDGHEVKDRVKKIVKKFNEISKIKV